MIFLQERDSESKILVNADNIAYARQDFDHSEITFTDGRRIYVIENIGEIYRAAKEEERSKD